MDRNLKDQILSELDSRIGRLQDHRQEEKPREDNQYAVLNHALSGVIGVNLEKELEDLRGFVQGL